jgi:hypothetical protein
VTGAPDSLRRASHQSDSIFQAEHGGFAGQAFYPEHREGQPVWFGSFVIPKADRLKPVLL